MLFQKSSNPVFLVVARHLKKRSLTLFRMSPITSPQSQSPEGVSPEGSNEALYRPFATLRASAKGDKKGRSFALRKIGGEKDFSNSLKRT